MMIGVANLDWATRQKKDRRIIAAMIPYFVFMGFVEARVDNIRDMFSREWKVLQDKSDPGRQGSAVAWRGRDVKIFKIRGLRMGTKPMGARMLTRWLAIVDVFLDGHKVRMIICHWPPPRYKWLWPLFDASVRMRIRRAPERGYWVILADFNRPLWRVEELFHCDTMGQEVVGIAYSGKLVMGKRVVINSVVAEGWTDHPITGGDLRVRKAFR